MTHPAMGWALGVSDSVGEITDILQRCRDLISPRLDPRVELTDHMVTDRPFGRTVLQLAVVNGVPFTTNSDGVEEWSVALTVTSPSRQTGWDTICQARRAIYSGLSAGLFLIVQDEQYPIKSGQYSGPTGPARIFQHDAVMRIRTEQGVAQ